VVQFTIAQTWIDPRLVRHASQKDFRKVSLDLTKIWWPFNEINDLVDVELTESWAYLTDENQVVQILRYNIDIKCSFHFAWLPFDWQK